VGNVIEDWQGEKRLKMNAWGGKERQSGNINLTVAALESNLIDMHAMKERKKLVKLDHDGTEPEEKTTPHANPHSRNEKKKKEKRKTVYNG